MWHIHVMECYSALQMDTTILIPVPTWMILEDMLIEINQIQKDKYCMIPLI